MGATLPRTNPALPTEVSPLFSDTTAARGDHMRANNGAIWDNFDYLLPVMDTFNYDLVVDSDAKFLLWQSGTYENVLIKAGTWTLASGGIDLTARGTKTVIGESGSVLVFTDVVAAEGGLYYTTIPTTNNYRMKGVNIDVTGSSAGNIIGFRNCINMTECTSAVIASNGSSHAIGFYICRSLVNCLTTGTGGASGIGYGFHSCSALINCDGTGIGGGTVGSGYGFFGCVNLSNCIGAGTGTGTNSTAGSGYGFYTCDNLSNCTGTGTGTGSPGKGYGFYSCNKLTNCDGTGSGTGLVGAAGTGCGFYSCSKLSDCVGTGTGTLYGLGFESSTNLSNCDGTGTGGSGGYGYGFRICTQVIGCAGVGLNVGSGTGHGFGACKKCCENKALATSKTATYDSSYADVGTAAACADTAAGGWNS